MTAHADFPRRYKDENSMVNVESFLTRWNELVTAPGPFELLRSAFGNIGSSREPGSYSAPDLCPHDPQWDEAIEPRVRPLVDVFVQRWGCVTYTSCEGHHYPGRQLKAVPLEVGLLPHDELNRHVLVRRLRELRRRLDVDQTWDDRTNLVVWQTDLRCQTTGRNYPAFDLVLPRREDVSWPDYFRVVPGSVERVVAAARSVPAPLK